MAFAKKILSFSFSVTAGSGYSATVSSLRATATIDVVDSAGIMDAAIYGMPLEQMSALTSLGQSFGQYGQNTVQVQAGDEGGQMSVVFDGDIFEAFMDGQSQPDVCFRIHGRGGHYNRIKPAPVTSVQGSADVAQMMSTLASQMGYQFENNGVNVKLWNPYLFGSPRVQAQMLAEHAGINHVIDKNTLAIWMPGQSRSGSAFLVAPPPAGNMKGYPTLYSAQLIVQNLYDPAVQFGGDITVQSSYTPANGTWNVMGLRYELESEMPNGRWFMTMTCPVAGQQTPPANGG